MGCERCGGLKIHDYFYGATEYFAWQCLGFRCVNCGAISKIQPIDSNTPKPRRDASCANATSREVTDREQMRARNHRNHNVTGTFKAQL